jgi:uncharacterized protein
MIIRVLLLLAVVLAALWLLRGGRRRESDRRDPASPRTPPREEMVSCRYCGLHLPRSEALLGHGDLFCSEAHRAAFEQAQG